MASSVASHTSSFGNSGEQLCNSLSCFGVSLLQNVNKKKRDVFFMDKQHEFDDFANDKEIKRQRKEKAEHLKMLESSIKEIKEAFNAKDSSQQNIKQFLLYKSIERPSVIKSITGEWNNKEIYISTIQYFSFVSLPRYHNAGTDEYLVGVITLKESYPHIIIKPEILALKIEDIFTKMDVDFKHAKLFSFLFYVVTKEKESLKQKFLSKDLNRLTKFLDAEIEIIGYNCYFRANRKSISLKEAEKFTKLAKTLSEIL